MLQVKVEMELEIQQCEKTKAVREEQLERLTQICQEQAVSSSCVASWDTAVQSWLRSVTLKEVSRKTTKKLN